VPTAPTVLDVSVQNSDTTLWRGQNQRKIKVMARKVQVVSRLIDRFRRIASNRLVWAALAGTLVWFADQPTVDGYNPLFEMFWNPGIFNIPNWDRGVLLLSWLMTTLFCHFLLFAFHKARQQK
jgi:hypothetical protein